MTLKYYVSLATAASTYSIFVLGYDSSGGFFLTDLCLRKGEYFVTRLKIHPEQMGAFGIHKIPTSPRDEWLTSYKPKIIHHTDGSVQISNPGIRSGFYKLTGAAKGVATKSSYFNDGGPIFTFVCWGLSSFPCDNKRGLIIFDRHSMYTDQGKFDTYNTGDEINDAYIFEGFYLPQIATSYVNLSNGIIILNHPVLGSIPAKYIPPPNNSLGFIAVTCRPGNRRFKSDYGISYGAGVSRMDSNGFFTQIQAIFPFRENSPDPNKRPRSLHFNFKDKLLSCMDNFFCQKTQGGKN